MGFPVSYYLGLRRGEALGLRWGDFEGDQVHIQRDIDYSRSTAADDTLKTEAADRYVPVPPELKKMLDKKRGAPDELVFHNTKNRPLPQATFKRMWCELMVAAGCAVWREGGEKERDIRKQVKPTLTPHYFRHNYVTMLYESGIDPLVAMRIVGHANYQTTADIYTHIKEDTLRRAAVDLNGVFRKREK